jgi:hypothetical protein
MSQGASRTTGYGASKRARLPARCCSRLLGGRRLPADRWPCKWRSVSAPSVASTARLAAGHETTSSPFGLFSDSTWAIQNTAGGLLYFGANVPDGADYDAERSERTESHVFVNSSLTERAGMTFGHVFASRGGSPDGGSGRRSPRDAWRALGLLLQSDGAYGVWDRQLERLGAEQGQDRQRDQ